jgi:predicted TIM-barrel fold metal-dependent hydrolase
MVDEDRVRFHWDLPFRIESLESEGIVGEVLFPDSIRSLGMPFATYPGDGDPYAPELLAVGYAAQNRWQAENIDPSRQVGLAVISYHDIDAAVREVRWAASAGLRGVLAGGIDPEYPPLHDEYFDPLWAACADASLPVHFHSGNGGVGALRATGARSGNRPPQGVDLRCIQGMENPQFDRRPLTFMINGGVFDRHPGLRMVFAEQGALWAARSIRKNDWAWENLGFRDSNCKRRPSEYYAEHVFFGVSNPFSRFELEARHETGINQLMWGSDHPHFGSPWGVTTAWLRATFGACHVPEVEARAMLGENLVRLYGLDLAQLRKIAERVGPTVSDALREPDASDLELPVIKVNLARPEDG